MPTSTQFGRLLGACLACTIALGASTPAAAQQLRPDPAFGTGGSVATGFTAQPLRFSTYAVNTPQWSNLGQVLVQADGKILVCGSSANRWVVNRYNADGTPDAGFGTNGVVVSAFPGNAVANGLAVQPDGKIVVVGGIQGSIGKVWAAARYSAQGAPDATFGVAGLAYPAPQSTSPSELIRVAVLPDGRLLAATSYEHGSPTRMMRLLANGQPDNTYGTGFNGMGIPFNHGFSALFQDLRQQPDGKVLITTPSAALTATANGARVERYSTAGEPDASFGTNGAASIAGNSVLSNHLNTPVFTAVYSLAVQPDGKVLLAGTVNNNQITAISPGETPVLLRLNADGTPDAAFNAAVARTITSTGGFAAVTVQNDGSIVVGGAVTPYQSINPHLVLARYSAAGVLDATFGTSSSPSLPRGVYSTTVGPLAVVRSLTALPNNQLLALEGTNSSDTGLLNMRLTRYLAAQPTAVRGRGTELQLAATPVPAAGRVQLRYTLTTAAVPRAEVRNQLGQVVATAGGIRQAAGAQYLTLDLQAKAAGCYFVTLLDAGSEPQTVRIVKQ